MIIDPRTGQPFPPAVTTPQTAHVAALHSRFDGHPISGLTPARMAHLLREAESGDIVEQAELFLDMEERSGHMASEMNKRRLRACGLPWDLKPPKNATPLEQANTEKLKALIESIAGLDEFFFDLTDAIGKGFSACEVDTWQKSSLGLAPRGFKHRSQTWFRITRVGADESLRLRDGSPDGAQLWPLGWVVHISKAMSASMVRMPLMRALAWPFMIRSFTLGDWAEFCEVYGHPVKIGKYGPSATTEDKRTLLRAVADIGRRAGGIISEGTVIELLSATEGDSGAFERLIAWCDRTESKLILGGTLTSQADGKSSTNALGDVHVDEALMIRDHDVKRLEGTLDRQLVWMIASVNGLFTRDRCPRIKVDTRQPRDLKTYSEALPALLDIGIEIGADWAADQLRIPRPDPTERKLARVAPVNAPNGAFSAPGPGDGSATGGAQRLNAFKLPLTALAGAPLAAKNPSEQLADQLLEETRPVLGDWLAQLKAIVERAESMESLQAMLLDAYGSLESDQLMVRMEAGFALAALKGSVDVAGGL